MVEGNYKYNDEAFGNGRYPCCHNQYAHIVLDWMNHETGKSRKLNDDDMMQMQTLASEILLMERG